VKVRSEREVPWGGREVPGGGREVGAGGGEVPITVPQRYKGQAAVLSGPPHGQQLNSSI
jgi:hypothetical protein